ncbi:hypothetical protein H5410_013960 [Solanum commersonii]|uniref:Uncharacterized protein n=1 Tax=Solanum commersonii TaxID=4109 RepID=A0A9J5ZPP2_SOLCO|nr:hypothetical protein H5410_013960 [Solanum commersonii]
MMQTQQYLQVLTEAILCDASKSNILCYENQCLLLLIHPRANTAVLTSEAGGTFKSTISFTSCRWFGTFQEWSSQRGEMRLDS